MSTLISELIGFLCMCKIIMLLISFGVEHIPKEIKTFINRTSSSASHNKNITTSIFRIQAYDSIICGYFCSGFIGLQEKL